MTSRLVGTAKRHRRILGLACALIFSSLAGATLAQGPIRVETNEVLVPVFVLDTKQVRLLLDGSALDLPYAILFGNGQLANKITDQFAIRGLTAADFSVLDDGKEQIIRSVTYEPSLYWDVHDSLGIHTEYIGPGGGKWSTSEWPPGHIEIDPPHYLIAYAFPESSAGSCHQVKVKVHRRNALVATRNEYCNSENSASDPLNGSKLDKKMESEVAAPKNNDLDMSVIAIAFYTTSDADRVHIAVDWPWESLKGITRTKGILGMVFMKDGRLVTRFSDLADRAGVSTSGIPELPGYNSDRPDTGPFESRYETQLSLPAGEYDLRVVLSDGTRFGRADVPLTVDRHDRNKLSTSVVTLCHQISDVSAYSPQHAPKLPGAWDTKIPGNYVPLVSKGYEYKPTGNTRFKKGETVYTYFEVYEPLLAEQSPPEVKMQVRIIDVANDKIKTDSPPESAMRYVKAGSTTIPIGLGVGVSMLPKGSYRLEVQVTDSAGQTTPWRTAAFTIE